MSHIIKIDLDTELPAMAWSDVTLLYPHDYIAIGTTRATRATEERIHRIVKRGINDVRKALKSKNKALDYLVFRDLVIDRLCETYGFIFVESSRHVILAKELNPHIECPTPLLGRLKCVRNP